MTRMSCARTLSADFIERALRKLSYAQLVLSWLFFHAWYTLSSERWSPSTWLKRALASSAGRWLSRGRMKGLGVLSIAVIERISFEQLSCGE